MDVPCYVALTERLHGIAENVTADGLNDIFYKLGSITFQPLPLLGGTDSFISYGFPAKAVLPYLRFDIRKAAAAGELDKEHAALPEEADIFKRHRDALLDGLLHGGIVRARRQAEHAP